MAKRRSLFDLVFRDMTRSRPLLGRALAAQVTAAALPFLKVRKGNTAEIAVTVVGVRRMRTLNRTHRKVDKPTDVLAFPLSQPKMKGYTHILLGDVFVCPEVVRAKARKMGNTDAHQVRWTLVHGLLHLGGYDHERSPRSADDMAKMERKILSKLR